MSFNLFDVPADRRIHCLLVGPSGVGKTSLAAGFPGKTFILDWDDRAKGVRGCPWLEEKIRNKEVEVETILPWQGNTPIGLPQVYDKLEILDGRITKGEIQNVIIDSTTSMRRFFVNDSINRGLKTSGKGSTLAHFKIGEAVMGGKPDHNYAATCMLNIIYDNAKTWRCNLFVTTHIKDKVRSAPTQDDPERTIVEGQTITAPGQLAEEIPSWFDEVWELESDVTNKALPPKRFVIFSGKWARTTLIGLPSHRIEITNKSLYETIKPVWDKMKEGR
jgi:hypothetical protein